MTDFTPEHGASSASGAWMVTFADLMLLLLTFFVLLFSMSDVKTEHWQAVVETLSQRLSAESARFKLVPTAERNVTKVLAPSLIDLDYLDTLLAEKISADPILAPSIVQRLDDRLVISLPSVSLFRRHSAALTEGGGRVVLGLAEMLPYIGNRVDINGHTDTAPLRSSRFASKWELSLARAIAVASILRRAGLSQKVTAFGLADSRFFHITPTLDRARRHQLADRVDIVIRETAGGGG